jgi:hypothetical protein
MSKPSLSVLEGGIAKIPERVDFECHHCTRPAVMYPLAKPITVMHSIPACDEWKRIESDKDDLARYLIKCGVHVHVPGSDVPR